MKFMTAIVALFVGIVSRVATAAPAPVARDIWDPTILSPNASTVWRSGEAYTVVWETADQPKQITNPNGFIILRSGDIETPVLLAWDFDIRDGQTDVVVPNVLTGNYSVVLFGDSGNWGETFEIIGPSGF
ncbi:hypothetical protein PHLCEN_2v9190 [Hermanssonia centrifuga]|uniref:Uncharacterized protein n=1 Tax=Hermanssonia centrifuga TaxID=98765 RepID=A0A2R6NRJ6_9APHY|nr:hypothetical protein PHLCEN_2v9190 [Hermanssonia centrifuga]